MIRTAVILAAGMGTRLRGEVADRPKGFLCIGEKPIIVESIQSLARAGIRDVLIVTGHLAGHYESFDVDDGVSLRTVHNPRYAESGSMYSLYCARESLTDSFLLLESDLIYEPRALTELLNHAADDAVLLSGPTGAGDEVWVSTDDGKLAGMSKDVASLGGAHSVTGELVGICKIAPALFKSMSGIAETAFASSLFFDYETDCLVATGRDYKIYCPVIEQLLWAEIDDRSHLMRAENQIYPAIVRRDGPI